MDDLAPTSTVPGTPATSAAVHTARRSQHRGKYFDGGSDYVASWPALLPASSVTCASFSLPASSPKSPGTLLNCVPPNPYVEVLTPCTSECDRALKETIKLNEAFQVGPSPI